jgi:transcriptional regulator with XRE-family HTH domain
MNQVRPVRGATHPSENPLKRLRHLCNLTLDQVAYQVGVSRQFIIRAEQGVYSAVPDSLLDFYGGRLEVDALAVGAEYYQFQLLTRKANYGRLIEPWTFPDVLQHPFIHWRLMSGVTSSAGICKLFCVHPATINKFEKRSFLMNAIPDQLVGALLESGYHPETLDTLEQSYKRYKLEQRNRLEVTTDEPE